MRSARYLALSVLFSLAACDCGGNDGRGQGDGSVDQDGALADGTVDGASADGQVQADGATGDGGLTGFCAGQGPLILTPGAGGAALCTGELAQTTFRYAVCTCQQFAVSNTFRTDSFNSEDGPYMMGTSENGGSFGTNGTVSLAASTSIGGSMWVGGASGLTANSSAGDLLVATDLRVDGPVGSNADVSVLRNAEVAGNLSAANLSVTGSLTQPAGATRTVAGTSTVGSTVTAPVAIPDPCACGASEKIDVAGFVTTYASANDNAAAGFDPAALFGFSGGATVDLPCGRLYAPAIQGTGKLTLRVNGRTALFVSGNLALNADFEVQVTGSGELDLFVAGNVSTSARIDLGNVSTPSRVRLYVGGSQSIALSGGAAFAGNVYAPNATVFLSTATEIYGSIFAQSIAASDTLTVHYDSAILEAGDECDPDPNGCDSCLDCNNQACVNGACGACTTDADCCSPLLCISGMCVPAVLD